MRAVVDDPLDAERRGRQAAEDIRRDFSPEAAGATMERRLATVREYLADGKPLRHPPVREPSSTIAAIEHLIQRGPAPRTGGRGGAARVIAQQLALRVTRPIIAYQQEIGGRLARHVENQDRALQRVRREAASQTARLLAEVRRSEAARHELDAELTALKARTQGHQPASRPGREIPTTRRRATQR
jgi:hypothetical protein